MSCIRGCTQLGRAISTMVDLAVEINFIADTTKIITHSGIFASLGRIRTYSLFLSTLRETYVYSEDTERFDSGFCVENVVTALCDGEHTINCELRMQAAGSKSPVWYNANFLRVDQTGNFDGRVVLILSDINHHKEIEAQAARLSQWVERDPLTGLYNKKASQTLIDAYLNGEGKNSRHTLLFCDLDDFKGINNSFGHPLGDALLSNIAEKLTNTFRREDILCRIGGDEFAVLIKNTSGRSYVSHRTDILLERMNQPIQLGDHTVNVTMSVGIAGYPDDGTTYSELLQNADKAMYVSKFNGKNQYYYYEDVLADENGTAMPVAKEVSSDTDVPPAVYKSRGKLSDYIFNCLYESTDITQTMPLVLQLMGTHFQLGRVAITEFRDDVLHIIRQWNANGIKELDKPIDYTGELRALFESSRSCENMAMRYDDIGQTPAQVRKKLLDAGIDDVYAFLHCPLLDNGAIRGYIVFFDCNAPRTWNEEERNTLSYVSRLISLFVFKQQDYERTLRAHRLAEYGLNGSPLSLIVVDRNTLKLIYVSQKTAREFPNAKEGQICYKALYGFDEPCAHCPMKLPVGDDPSEARTLVHHNPEKMTWHVFSAANVDIDGHEACLCGRVDTTMYKVREIQLEKENAELRAKLAALTGKKE